MTGELSKNMRGFTRMACLALLTAAAALPAQPGEGDRGRARPDPCAPRPQLYIAPMGEVFRAPADAVYPSAVWFAAADEDRDGRLTLKEFLADAARAFDRFDLDHDGEIDPTEMTAYEAAVPEISLYQRGQRLATTARERKDAAQYGGALGAGRYAQLNIPQPIASADLDFNRGVSRDEWRTVAARRFQLLGPVDGALTLAALPPTPAQQTLIDCAARAAKDARKRR